MQVDSRQSVHSGHPGSSTVILWSVHEILLSPFIAKIPSAHVEMNAL